MFHTCIQNGRSFDSFLNDIEKQSYFWDFCEFGSLEERLIRDRVLCDIDSNAEHCQHCRHCQHKIPNYCLDLEHGKILSTINVHHITRESETDNLIKEYAHVFKELGMIE